MEGWAIEKLDESVIRRIAAGEVIHQPSNVVKELLENAIDAGSKSITITVENGGFALIRISDDGCGIRRSDLPVACRRHTTSKLREYKDLSHISTFGFRGEALFSISCCARLSILTKRADSETGYLVQYADGEIVGDIEEVSANNGTTVEVRDLFYNNPVRLQGRSKASVETRKIGEMVAKYSVVYPEIRFVMINNGKEWYRSPGNSTFDGVLAKLYEGDDPEGFFKLVFPLGPGSNAELYLSSPGNAKPPKSSAVFINGRLVVCKRIDRGIEGAYADALPRGCHPFFFAVLTLPGENVDVNIHPSKKEVVFLNDVEIVEMISEKVREALKEKQETRGVQAMTLSPPKRSPVRHSQPKAIPENQTTILQFGEVVEKKEPVKPEDLVQREEQLSIDSEKEDFGNDFAIPNDPVESKPAEDVDDEIAEDSEEASIGDVQPLVRRAPPVIRNPELAVERSESPVKVSERPRPLSDNLPTVNEQREEPEKVVFRPPAMLNETIESSDPEEPQPCPVRPLPPVRERIPPKVEQKAKKMSLFDELRFEPAKQKAPAVDPTMRTIEQVLTCAPKSVIPKAYRVVNLISVRELREAVLSNEDLEMCELFRNHEFVGFIGLRCILLRSHETIYMCSLFAIIREFFYQRMLDYFANFPQLRLNPPVKLSECLECQTPDYEEVLERLYSKSALLRDYFSIMIENGILYALPYALEGYQPTLSALPLFLLKLASAMEIETEKECFYSVLDNLASLYSVTPIDESDPSVVSTLQHAILNVILPEMRKEQFHPSVWLKNDQSVMELPH